MSPVNEFKCIVHWMARQSQESVHLLLSALCSNESSEDDAIDFGEFSLVSCLCLFLGFLLRCRGKRALNSDFFAVSLMFSS